MIEQQVLGCYQGLINASYELLTIAPRLGLSADHLVYIDSCITYLNNFFPTIAAHNLLSLNQFQLVENIDWYLEMGYHDQMTKQELIKLLSVEIASGQDQAFLL